MLSWLKNLFAPAVVKPAVHANAAKALQAAARSTTKNAVAVDPATAAGAPAAPGENTALRFTKLIMVTADNNNKYYEMKEDDQGCFTVTYGRIGGGSAKAQYPISEWDKKKSEKIKKGYKDHTALFSLSATGSDLLEIEDKAVSQLVEELAAMSRQSILNNYHVAANQVTRQQVEKAQELLDGLSGLLNLGMDIHEFNKNLLALFEVIPRKMKNVRDHIASEAVDSEEALGKLEKDLAAEQATLDVMRGEVETLERQKEQAPGKKINLLEAMGLEMEAVTDEALLQHIRKMMGSDHRLFRRAFKVTNLRTQQQFGRFVANHKNQRVELFWHGSRNENWLSILKTGLVLRPANAVITGKMFGYGLYFADKFRKSLNYTSLSGSYWAGGRENKAWLALYEVHLGQPLTVTSHESWCSQLTKDALKKKGSHYDSVFAKSGVSLVNNEYIVYDQSQCTVSYLVEVAS